jgi:DNA-binding NtrC family response regulator
MQAAQITKPSLLGQRLLLVEDDAGVRESLQLRLESWGAQVQAWATVAELTQALQQGQVASRPGLLISDQRLPDGDSTDVVAVLAKHHAGVPVLVITGDTAPADLARLNALAWPVLHKPFGTEALFEAVLNATRREAHKA